MPSDLGIALISAGSALAGGLIGAALSYFVAKKAADVNASNARLSDNTVRALKLTDHRVAWIQRLRDEMAIFQSWGMTPGVDQTSKREFYEHGTRIELLMNPKDPEYALLQKLMYQLLSAEHVVDKYAVNEQYVFVCQHILKREWDIAKKEIRGDFF